jgi:hypothetical protein
MEKQMKRLAISFSGGRTSAVMTKLLLERYRGTDTEVSVTFANTGCEHPTTLEFVRKCDEVFGFGTVWMEGVTGPEGVGMRHKVVTFETASRNGEPFQDYISKFGVPCQSHPQCTSRLKEDVMYDYRRSIGWTRGTYKTAIGIRVDEADRCSAKADEHGFVYPLVEWGWNKDMISAECAKWPFDLELPGDHYGNCFSGDTEFITPSGVRKMSESLGQVIILNRKGWCSGVVSSFGRQPVVDLHLRNQNREKTIRVTLDHKWFTPKYKTSHYDVLDTVKTKDLSPGDKLACNFSRCVDFDAEAVVHGFSYGDGSLEGNSVRVYIDPNKDCVRPYFEGRGYRLNSNHRLAGIDPEFKNLPSVESPESYKVGFLAGLVAADGSVGQAVKISNKSREVIDHVVDLAQSVGMIAHAVGPIYRSTNYKEDAEISHCIIPNSCFPDELLIRKFHRESRPTRRTNPKMWELRLVALVWCWKNQSVNY